MHEKIRSRLAIALGGLALVVAGGGVRAGEVFCHCPPPLTWCAEQAPCIKFKCACPRPVCDPCTLEHYGVFATCWQPWPFQPNWSHCRTTPPGVALPAPAYPPYTPRAPQERRADPARRDEFPKPRPSELKDEPDSPQVRNTSYRAVERPAISVTEAPRPLAKEIALPELPAQVIDAPSLPVLKPQESHGGVRLITQKD